MERLGEGLDAWASSRNDECKGGPVVCSGTVRPSPSFLATAQAAAVKTADPSPRGLARPSGSKAAQALPSPPNSRRGNESIAVEVRKAFLLQYETYFAARGPVVA